MIWFDSLSLKKKKPRSFMHLCGHVSVGNLGLKLKKTSANISLDFERKGCAAHRSTSWWWWRGPRRRGRVPEWHKARSYQSSSSSIPSSARHPQSPWRQTDGAAGQETCQTDASVHVCVILISQERDYETTHEQKEVEEDVKINPPVRSELHQIELFDITHIKTAGVVIHANCPK